MDLPEEARRLEGHLKIGHLEGTLGVEPHHRQQPADGPGARPATSRRAPAAGASSILKRRRTGAGPSTRSPPARPTATRMRPATAMASSSGKSIPRRTLYLESTWTASTDMGQQNPPRGALRALSLWQERPLLGRLLVYLAQVLRRALDPLFDPFTRREPGRQDYPQRTATSLFGVVPRTAAARSRLRAGNRFAGTYAALLPPLLLLQPEGAHCAL